MSLPRLNVLGCGRAAGAVATALVACGAVAPGQICNRTWASSVAAAGRLAGRPVETLQAMASGDWLLLGLPDAGLRAAAEELARADWPRPALVFHLSASRPASDLSALGITAASVHPLKSFAIAESDEHALRDVWCAIEGDPGAVRILGPVFERAGARVVGMNTAGKTLYHAAAVAASNFLVTLNALATDLAARAGLERGQAASMLADLQQQTLENIHRLGTAQALTGPIERGDHAAFERLLTAVAESIPEHLPAFRVLAQATLEVARAKAPERADWAAFEKLLRR